MITYNQFDIKYDLNYSTNGEYVSFNQKEWYLYNPDLSSLHPNDTIIIISPFIAAIDNYYHNLNLFDKIIYNEILSYINNKPNLLFLKGTVYHLLFDLLSLNITLKNGTILTIGKYGILNNNTIQFGYTLNTGYYDHSKYGEIIKYQNKLFVDCWNPPMLITNDPIDYSVHMDYFGLWKLYNKPNTTVIAWVR